MELAYTKSKQTVVCMLSSVHLVTSSTENKQS